jgi:hypothetical protein
MIRDVEERNKKSEQPVDLGDLIAGLKHHFPMPKKSLKAHHYKKPDLSKAVPLYGEANHEGPGYKPKNPPAENKTVYAAEFSPKKLEDCPKPPNRRGSSTEAANHIRSPPPNDSEYKNTYLCWQAASPAISFKKAKPSNIGISQMPFFGSPIAADYGRFVGSQSPVEKKGKTKDQLSLFLKVSTACQSEYKKQFAAANTSAMSRINQQIPKMSPAATSEKAPFFADHFRPTSADIGPANQQARSDNRKIAL